MTTTPSDISALICVKSLKKQPAYPRALWQAFETLFRPEDIVIYHPLMIKEGQNVVFDILSISSGAIYRYDFTKSNFIFNDVSPDDDGEELEDILHFLSEVEERLTGDGLLDRINFIEHRATSKAEFETLCHFYRFLQGNDHYFKEKPKEIVHKERVSDDKSSRNKI